MCPSRFPDSGITLRETRTLRPGDVVAEHVKDVSGALLVRRGVELDAKTIDLLDKRGVPEVQIVREAGAGKPAAGEVMVDASGNEVLSGGGDILLTVGKGNLPQAAKTRLRHVAQRLELGFSKVSQEPGMTRVHQHVIDYLAAKITTQYQ